MEREPKAWRMRMRCWYSRGKSRGVKGSWQNQMLPAVRSLHGAILSHRGFNFNRISAMLHCLALLGQHMMPYEISYLKE